MRISGLAVALPSRKVTNNDVLEMVRRESEQTLNGSLDTTLRIIDRTLRQTGTATRYWLGPNESSLSVTRAACQKAIAKLTDDRPIDLVISASVYGELTEPATANVLAAQLGLDFAEAFDMKEACDGWVKAMKVARALLKQGEHRRILIVNGEFSMVPNYAIMPQLFKLPSPEVLEWRFPIFTVGEGATATIVDADGSSEWAFTNKTRNDLYDLCSVAPPWFTPGEMTERIGMDGPGNFTSFAGELTGNGIPLAIETFKESGIAPMDVDLFVSHASSEKDWTKIAKAIGLHNKHRDIHARTGNLVSASIPAALALAEEDGVLKRGMNVVALCASAGMTFSTMKFVY